jgi:hypothetical protein
MDRGCDLKSGSASNRERKASSEKDVRGLDDSLTRVVLVRHLEGEKEVSQV